MKINSKYILSIGIFLVFCAMPVSAMFRVINVLPAVWDARQDSEGWKVLLYKNGTAINDIKQDEAGKEPKHHAWAILESLGLQQEGNWLSCFDATDSSGQPFSFCFYHVDSYKEYLGYQWLRISHGFDLVPGQRLRISADLYPVVKKFLAQQVSRGLQARSMAVTLAPAQAVPPLPAQHARVSSQQAALMPRQALIPAVRQIPAPVPAPSLRPAQSTATLIDLALTIPAAGQHVAYTTNPPMQGWYAFKGAILFDRPTEPSFAFTNFYQAPVIIPNFYTGVMEKWPAVENYFQAMKTQDPAIQERLRAMTPAAALTNKPTSLAHWNDIRFSVMHMALQAKFSRGTVLGNLLLSTGDRVLVEKTCGRRHQEADWGADDGLNGNNHLGRMLMVIRDSMKDNQDYPYDPRNTYTLQKVNAALTAGKPLTAAR